MAQPKLNQRALSSIPVPQPDAGVQADIVSKLDAGAAEVRDLQELYTDKLTLLGDLKKSLLARAFSGELTGGKLAA